MTVPDRAATPALLQIDAIGARLAGRQALAEVCRFLASSFPAYRWVGVYRLEGTTLVLDAFEGRPTEHARIPIDRGICGQAAREGRTVIVDDVRENPHYLACFIETRAEIVVPIRHGGAVVGEIDIDGHEVRAFDASDRRFLEAVAAKLGPAVARAAQEPAPPP
ncbi:MAG TPA: GAF domain-containing protein [Thermoplasmata archaeon]|jgi:L-methionine (R)-S-oxide reductase|nr:GAF domain-containing protein [Thermoplasmata archaeon]